MLMQIWALAALKGMVSTLITSKESVPANKPKKAECNHASPSKKKIWHSGHNNKGKGQVYYAEHSPSHNSFTLATPAILEPAHPMIVL